MAKTANHDVDLESRRRLTEALGELFAAKDTLRKRLIENFKAALAKLEGEPQHDEEALYKYEGPAGQFGNELQAELADGSSGIGPNEPTMALVLATTVRAIWEAMEKVFKTAEPDA